MKAWYQSKTIWGAVVAILGLVAGAFGYGIGAEDQASLIDIMTTTGASLGGLLAIYGRVVSEKGIG